MGDELEGVALGRAWVRCNPPTLIQNDDRAQVNGRILFVVALPGGAYRLRLYNRVTGARLGERVLTCRLQLIAIAMRDAEEVARLVEGSYE